MLFIVAVIQCVAFLTCVSGQSLDNCPEDMLVPVPYPMGEIDVTWTEPTPPSNEWTKTFQSHTPRIRLRVGVTFVTYIYADQGGANELTCMFRVIVEQEDAEAPVVSGCPESPLIHDFEVGPGHAFAYWSEPEATDNSGLVVLVERTYSPGELIYIRDRRNFQVKYVFEDPFSNRGYCSFELRFNIVDTTPPRIKHCPYAVTRDVPLDSDGTVVSWDMPEVRDNSEDWTLRIEPEIATNFFPVGLTTLNYTYTDPSGNFDTCTINVFANKRDITPPELTHCPSELVYGIRPGEEYADVHWYPAGAEDDSGIVYTEQNHFPGVYPVARFPLAVEYVFRDPAWNEVRCSFVVAVVTDEEPPAIFGCPPGIVEGAIPDGASSTNVTWVEPIARDDTVQEYPFQTHYPGSEFRVGNTAVDYVFEDSAGNIAVCSFVIRVTYENDETVNEGGNEVVIIVIIVCITAIAIIVALLIACIVYRRYRRDREQEAAYIARSGSPSPPPLGHVNESYTTLIHPPKRPLPSIRSPPSGASTPSPPPDGEIPPILDTPTSPTAETAGYIQPIAS